MSRRPKQEAASAATIQAAVDEVIRGFPRHFAREMFRRKLAEAGVSGHDSLVDALTEHLFEQPPNTDFVWKPNDESQDVLSLVVEITDEDLGVFQRCLDKFVDDDLPQIVRETINRSAKSLVHMLKRRWPEQYARELHDITGFRMRLEERWGKAFHALRMLITVCRELGNEAHARRKRSRSKKNIYRTDVLIRLHARACQVTSEMLVLMEAGFADGAMARWRTLHEIAVVAALIAEHGDDLAERYLAHEAVQSKRALDIYREIYPELRHPPPNRREAKHTEDVFNYFVAKYGREFAADYGWASRHLGIRQPKFRDLERAASRLRLRSHYKLASDHVHAGVKGITFRLAVLDNAALILAGPSNAGFEEPGQLAGIDLAQITLHLVDTSKINELSIVKALALMQNEVVASFVRSGRQLRREETDKLTQGKKGKGPSSHA